MIDKQQFWAEEIGKFLSGNSTAEESKALSSWIEEMNENRAFFEEMKSVWQITQPIDLVADLDVNAQWQSIQNRLQSGKQPGTKLRVMYRVVAAAAAIALLVIMVQIMNRDSAVIGNHPVLVSSEISDDNSTIQLPDGSTVWLRAGSQVSYDSDFASRDVQLKGEGFFDVVSDPDSPFKVSTANAVVQVLGTRFNLKEKVDGDVELFVEEGRVEFTSEQPMAKKELVTRDQMAVLRVQTLAIDRIESPKPNVLSWKTGKLVFDDALVSQVFMDLERHYGVSFVVEDQELLNCDLKADFEDASINEVIQTIEFSLSWQLSEENDVYYIKGNPCTEDK